LAPDEITVVACETSSQPGHLNKVGVGMAGVLMNVHRDWCVEVSAERVLVRSH
jgi:hypothetical protein